jgi:catechol 2,3-dioxygenase-like lactoylglutathione lyase family enzyme
MLKRVLHTGIEAADIKQAARLYENLGFRRMYELDKPDLHGRLLALKRGDTVIELWQFDDHDHPYYQFIRSHIGLLSDDLDGDVGQLIKEGFKVVIPKTEGALLRYVFVQDPASLCYEVAVEK